MSHFGAKDVNFPELFNQQLMIYEHHTKSNKPRGRFPTYTLGQFPIEYKDYNCCLN